MREIELTVLLVASVAVVVAGCVQSRRQRRALAREELAYLRDVVASPVVLGERGRSAVAGRLAGRIAGAELVTDALAAPGGLPRQLLVLRFPTRSAGTWRLEAVRPQPRGALFTGTLPDAPEVRDRDRWGTDVVVRAVGEERVPEDVWRQLAGVVANTAVRQLLVRPDGVRLVFQVGVARRSAYRVTRRVEMERTPATAESLRAAMHGTAELAELVSGRDVAVTAPGSRRAAVAGSAGVGGARRPRRSARCR